jgi:DNA-binding MarR family transcriptional regulator
MARALSDRDFEALARFRRALRVFVRFSEDAARAEGLTPAQHQLLLAIRGHPGPDPPSASDVAEALQLRVHSTVELIQRAVTAGLVRRRADPTDGRRQLLELTTTGERHLTALSLLHRAELHRFRKDMVDLLKALD